ncbi:MAG: FAD-dependent oxidoreductase [Bacteroidota bacterium]
MSGAAKIAVVGQGIIGLSTASRLMADGHAVDIFSKDPFEATTSMAAGAYWWPHKAYPQERVSAWAASTYRRLVKESTNPASGVFMAPHFRFCLDPDDGAYARYLLDDWEAIDGAAYGRPCPEAYKMMVPVIDVPIYMPRLRNQLIQAGAKLIQEEIDHPDSLFPAYDLVVNCTGVWASTFVDDPTVYPIRGQAVRLSLPHNLQASTRIFQHDDQFTLILPRTSDVILGGTAQEGSWETSPSEQDTQTIVNRCRGIVPEIADSAILGTTVGLRPGRKTVRLERTKTAAGNPIIHNYGHGGGGFTIAWGCAEEVALLIRAQDSAQTGK